MTRISGVRLSKAQLAGIEKAAAEAYPEECCGLLVGRVSGDGTAQVARIVASPNLAGAFAADGAPSQMDCGVYRRDHFEVDPEIRLKVMREVEGDDTARILGLYHSHPGHPARPSPRDVAAIYEPDLIWLIVGVEKGAPKETAAYLPWGEGGGFDELALEIT